jgi:hypothetical protein
LVVLELRLLQQMVRTVTTQFLALSLLQVAVAVALGNKLLALETMVVQVVELVQVAVLVVTRLALVLVDKVSQAVEMMPLLLTLLLAVVVLVL